MLKTMREALNAERLDVALETYMLDAGDRAEVRDTVLESMGECDTDCDPDVPDEDVEKLIDTIPETDIDDADSFMEGDVVGKDELGNDKKMSVDDVEKDIVPETEEV